jgi:hypothetical protein
MMNRIAAAALSIAVAGCVEKADIPVAPVQILSMQVSASPRDLPRGESMTLTVTLTNTLDETVRLSFPTTCQVVLFIRDSGNRVVARHRTDDCATVPSLITLHAGQSATFTFVWSGESELGPPGSGSPLPAGNYYASAEMEADGYTGIAFPLLVTLLN